MDTGFNLAVEPRRVTRLTVFTVPTTLLVFFLTFGETGHSTDTVVAPSVQLKGYSLTYYRPPHPSQSRDQLLDRFDSFQKDETGRLLIKTTGQNRFSQATETFYLGYVVQTHRGNPIQILLQLPNRQHADQSNCHGYTFLNGEYWMLSSQVETILQDNGWTPVTQSETRADDVAVYREANGRIFHTARVTGRDAEGHVLVNSKNGFGEAREGVRAVEAPLR